MERQSAKKCLIFFFLRLTFAFEKIEISKSSFIKCVIISLSFIIILYQFTVSAHNFIQITCWININRASRNSCTKCTHMYLKVSDFVED